MSPFVEKLLAGTTIAIASALVLAAAATVAKQPALERELTQLRADVERNHETTTRKLDSIELALRRP